MKSVTVSIPVSKMRVVLHQAWSESQWTVLLTYLTVSTNVSCYQARRGWQFCLWARQCSKTVHWCIVCTTQSNCCSMKLSTSFLLICSRSTAESLTSLTRDLGSHTVVWVWVEDNKTEEIKQRQVEVWQQHLSEKMQFLCFWVLPGSTDALVRWSGKISTFWLLPKMYLNWFTFVKVIASKRWDIFKDTDVLSV